MPQSERLAAEYAVFVGQFGYRPATLANSVDDVRRRIEMLARSPAERQKRESELDEWIATTDQDALTGVEAEADPSGYGHFLDDVLNSPSIRRTTTDSVYCGEFPTGEFNASARRARTGNLILLNQGLRRLIYNACLAGSLHVQDANQPLSSLVARRSPAWGEIAAQLIGVLLNYFQGDAFFSPQSSNYSPQCLTLASGLSSSIRTFVIAHEVAHAELGHLDQGSAHNMRTPLGDVEVIAKSYDQEFEADQLAQQVLIEIARRDRSVGPICGGVGFIMLDAIAELARSRFFGHQAEPSTTHPPAPQRLSAVMTYVESQGEAVEYEWCVTALKFFEQLYEAIDATRVSFTEDRIEVSFDVGPE
ncbi:hypothetical protein FHR83_008039 [Actinoplanes campanulatus]|uniref:Uncharacterized protein n=1 Tax=Actinoplanes campanulatus TaxID=113559 RepID=A0A7W5FJ79_9ACTN|nr:hypothetical protein [Actinoplanes campanulatus]MBB3100317.1 hypothetical protein [Actinoplanes campanulatus]GGN43906.1 hypothetical protein GCM10010109_76530 [Actinoplanes campanulatus]GID40881.1 hypothetical protein Aca09nite_73870 [Actinoplanes campanulatus]